MAEMIPFRGYRYDPAVAGEVGKLLAPPYDVIHDELREALFRLSPYNIARLIRADRLSASGADSPYAGAAALWSMWRETGVVKPEPRPVIYAYEQHFEVHGSRFCRTAVVALVRLEPLGHGVLPHEATLTAPRMDRLDLMRATRAQFGQVFGLYSDPGRRVEGVLENARARRPILHAVDYQGHLHRLWAVADPEAVGLVQETMRDKEILIADGHHRYETSLAYREEHPDDEAAGFRMMTLVNMTGAGLVILPTHRLVRGLAHFSVQALLDRLRALFEVRSYPGDAAPVRSAVLDHMRAHQAAGRHAFGLYLGNGRHHLLLLRRDVTLPRVPGRSEAWQGLDVALLHRLVLQEILDITEEKLQSGSHLDYVQDFPHAVEAAAERVRSGSAQALFLLNPPRVEQVYAVARSGERMPQKSTFFYPKVYSGVVIYSMDPDSLRPAEPSSESHT